MWEKLEKITLISKKERNKDHTRSPIAKEKTHQNFHIKIKIVIKKDLQNYG
jgi:hypothetical protein